MPVKRILRISGSEAEKGRNQRVTCFPSETFYLRVSLSPCTSGRKLDTSERIPLNFYLTARMPDATGLNHHPLIARKFPNC